MRRNKIDYITTEELKQSLRIGNWIDLDDVFISVTSAVMIEILKRQLNWMRIVRPIPLTEEILLKCGFKKCNHDNNLYLNIGRVYVATNDENKTVHLYDVSDTIIVEIKYLHQLQNLYYFFTGKELTVNI